MRGSSLYVLPFLLALQGACTGLTAGPEVAASIAAPVPRDTAWVRTKRALQAEVFTIAAEDSLGGRITGMRYPSATAKVGTPAACRVLVSYAIVDQSGSVELASTSRWIAPDAMAAKPDMCEEDRQETLGRIQQTVVPAQQ